MFNYNYVDNFINKRNTIGLQTFFDDMEKKNQNSVFLMSKETQHLFFEIINKFGKTNILNKCILFEQYINDIDDITANNPHKNIYLVDLTLSSGYKLFRWYCRLSNLIEGKKIYSFVYSLSTEYPRDSLNERMRNIYYEINEIDNSNITDDQKSKAINMWRDFKATLYCSCYLNQEDISLLNIDTIKLLQNDLNYLTNSIIFMSGKDNGRFFTLSNNQFDKITNDNNEWRFFPIDTQNTVKGVFGEKIELGYFEYIDNKICSICDSVLQNMIVFCKYLRSSDNDDINICFSPIAIGRSIQKKDLLKNFYVTQRINFSDEQIATKTHEIGANDWIHIFYMLIFSLSIWIGKKFKFFLQNKGLNPLDLEWNLTSKKNVEEIEKMDASLLFSNITCKNDYQKKECKNFEFLNFFRKIKNQITQWENKGKTLINLNELEAFLKNDKKLQGTLKNEITSLFLLLTEANICSSTVSVNKETVQFGLIPGKNNDLFLSEAEHICHICSDVLYISLGSNNYNKCKSEFLDSMQNNLKENHIFENSEQEKEFEEYSSVIKSTLKEDSEYKIIGKRFLIRNLTEKIKNVQKKAIQILEEKKYDFKFR